MPTSPYPVSADSYSNTVIQSDGNYSGTTTDSQANNFRSIFTPGKMLVPFLLTWMKKSDSFSALGVYSLCFSPFVLITQLTSQAQVVFNISAAFGSRYNMIDLKYTHHVVLMAQTIFTAIACPLSHPLTGSFRKIAHGDKGARKPR
jgi:hypothetical protein